MQLFQLVQGYWQSSNLVKFILLGIYRSCYRPKGAKGITAYYIMTPGKRPSELPGGNSKWYTTLVSEVKRLGQWIQDTTQPALKRTLPEESAPATSTKQAKMRKKRKVIATRGSMKENVVGLTRIKWLACFKIHESAIWKGKWGSDTTNFRSEQDVGRYKAQYSRKSNSEPELVGITWGTNILLWHE